jgi:eukaryotic-like serine/threonine-protein kinase
MEATVSEKQSWELDEGAEIAPGRSVLKLLGGGHIYEVYLVWDDRLFAIMVAKLLRPDLIDHERPGTRPGAVLSSQAGRSS